MASLTFRKKLNSISPSQLPPPRGARQGRERHRRRYCLVRHGRPGRHLHAGLDGHDRGAAEREGMEWRWRREKKDDDLDDLDLTLLSSPPQKTNLSLSDGARLEDLPDQDRLRSRLSGQGKEEREKERESSLPSSLALCFLFLPFHFSSHLSLSVLLSELFSFSFPVAPDPSLHDQDQHGLRLRRRDGKRRMFFSLFFSLRPEEFSALKKPGEKKKPENSQKVDPRHFHILANWRRAYTLERILVDLRQEMSSPANRKLAQPVEGSTYE